MREGEIRERVHELLLGLKRPATQKDLLKLLRAKAEARVEAKRVLEKMIS